MNNIIKYNRTTSISIRGHIFLCLLFFATSIWESFGLFKMRLLLHPPTSLHRAFKSKSCGRTHLCYTKHSQIKSYLAGFLCFISHIPYSWVVLLRMVLSTVAMSSPFRKLSSCRVWMPIPGCANRQTFLPTCWRGRQSQRWQRSKLRLVVGIITLHCGFPESKFKHTCLGTKYGASVSNTMRLRGIWRTAFRASMALL